VFVARRVESQRLYRWLPIVGKHRDNTVDVVVAHECRHLLVNHFASPTQIGIVKTLCVSLGSVAEPCARVGFRIILDVCWREGFTFCDRIHLDDHAHTVCSSKIDYAGEFGEIPAVSCLLKRLPGHEELQRVESERPAVLNVLVERFVRPAAEQRSAGIARNVVLKDKQCHRLTVDELAGSKTRLCVRHIVNHERLVSRRDRLESDGCLRPWRKGHQ